MRWLTGSKCKHCAHCGASVQAPPCPTSPAPASISHLAVHIPHLTPPSLNYGNADAAHGRQMATILARHTFHRAAMLSHHPVPPGYHPVPPGYHPVPPGYHHVPWGHHCFMQDHRFPSRAPCILTGPPPTLTGPLDSHAIPQCKDQIRAPAAHLQLLHTWR